MNVQLIGRAEVQGTKVQINTNQNNEQSQKGKIKTLKIIMLERKCNAW